MATYQEQIEKAAKRRELKEELVMATLRGDDDEARRLKWQLTYGEGQANGYLTTAEEQIRKPQSLGDLLWWKIHGRAK